MYTLTAENKYGEQLELTHNPCYDITDIAFDSGSIFAR